MHPFEDRLRLAPILVVDDLEANVLLLENMLRQRGYSNVTSTTNPYAVAELHKQHQFALILLDMQMPGLDGLGVMKTLVEDGAVAPLPVLVITAQTDADLRLSALAAGARDYVSKPFVVAELVQRMRNLLEVELRTAELAAAEARVRELIYGILPRKIADELIHTGITLPRRHDVVSVLFTDFAGFTQAAATMPADQMVSELDDIFAGFDDVCAACGVERIKTIGDAYMAAAGVPENCPDHAERAIRAGLGLLDFIAARNRESAFKWNLRVGVHSGPVVAGVVGRRRQALDLGRYGQYRFAHGKCGRTWAPECLGLHHASSAPRLYR